MENGQGNSPSDPVLLFDMSCRGTERHISECNFEDHSQHRHVCVGTEQAGLKCRKATKTCDKEYQFHCKNRECINVNSLCDGKIDCVDGSDEDHQLCGLDTQIRYSYCLGCSSKELMI